MNIQLAGVTFCTDRNPKLKKLRPCGFVSFEEETDEKVLAHDENAVKAYYKSDHIGYVPKSPIVQKMCLEKGTAQITSYAYFDNAIKWNEKHIGVFQSLTMTLDETQVEDNGRIIGGKYIRVTSFLKAFDPYLSGADGLIKWAFDKSIDGTFDGYKEALNKVAEDGTKMHEAIENAFRNNLQKGDEEYIPQGLGNFIDKYKPEFVWGEERFFDNDLMVTGQPDFAGYIDYKGNRIPCILDWKSSKRPSKKHEMQISIYAMNSMIDNENPTGAMVVAFGSNNQQGYSVKFLSREDIESNYLACKHIKKAMDCVGVYIKEYYEETLSRI